MKTIQMLNVILCGILFFTQCSKPDPEVPTIDDVGLSITSISNLKMACNIDTAAWAPTMVKSVFDTGGLSLIGVDIKKSGPKDTIYRDVVLDLLLPLYVERDSILNTDDTYGHLILEDNILPNSEREFGAIPGSGYIEITGIDESAKLVTGTFTFSVVFNTTNIKKLTSGTFSFNYQ